MRSRYPGKQTCASVDSAVLACAGWRSAWLLARVPAVELPNSPSSAAWPLSERKTNKKTFMAVLPFPPTCFVFVSHMLPFLWQMELSKEVKDDAVQLCGSGVMRPGASAAWQQEPGDATGPQIWPAGRSEKLPADSQPWALPKHWARVAEADLQSCMATFSLWQQMMHFFSNAVWV